MLPVLQFGRSPGVGPGQILVGFGLDSDSSIFLLVLWVVLTCKWHGLGGCLIRAQLRDRRTSGKVGSRGRHESPSRVLMLVNQCCPRRMSKASLECKHPEHSEPNKQSVYFQEMLTP